jgi:hypothetical protein
MHAASSAPAFTAGCPTTSFRCRPIQHFSTRVRHDANAVRTGLKNKFNVAVALPASQAISFSSATKTFVPQPRRAIQRPRNPVTFCDGHPSPSRPSLGRSRVPSTAKQRLCCPAQTTRDGPSEWRVFTLNTVLAARSGMHAGDGEAMSLDFLRWFTLVAIVVGVVLRQGFIRAGCGQCRANSRSATWWA